MAVSLHLVTLPELLQIQEGATAIAGIDIEDGALPPTFLTEMAIDFLSARKSAQWCSYFLFVEGSRAVGSGGFRGVPTDGRVEIGYGVAPGSQRKGIATEGARLLVENALDDESVVEVYAETAVTNPSSRRVVEKAGFLHVGQRDTESDGLVDCWLIKRA